MILGAEGAMFERHKKTFGGRLTNMVTILIVMMVSQGDTSVKIHQSYIHFLLCSLLYELYLQRSVEVKTHYLSVLLRLNELILTCSKALSKY